MYVGQGTLCEDERQFLFHSVFVGTQVKARLKLVNKTKVSMRSELFVCSYLFYLTKNVPAFYAFSPAMTAGSHRMMVLSLSCRIASVHACTHIPLHVSVNVVVDHP